MNAHEKSDIYVKPGSGKKLLTVSLLAVIMLVITFVGTAAPAAADGALQISGEAILDGSGAPCERVDFPDGFELWYSLPIEGDLEGCIYVQVYDYACSPSGTYRETGLEFYDITGGELGRTGTFTTEYRVTGKWEECPPGLQTPEIFGRCQHPIVAGSGTGEFLGVTGRLDFKDFPEDNFFPFRGHMRGLPDLTG